MKWDPNSSWQIISVLLSGIAMLSAGFWAFLFWLVVVSVGILLSQSLRHFDDRTLFFHIISNRTILSVEGEKEVMDNVQVLYKGVEAKGSLSLSR